MDVALKVPTSGNVQALVPVCFNPCSLGCCSESHLHHQDARILWRVSILVLLDVALKDSPPPARNGHHMPGVSILVLLDVALKEQQPVPREAD